MSVRPESVEESFSSAKKDQPPVTGLKPLSAVYRRIGL